MKTVALDRIPGPQRKEIAGGWEKYKVRRPVFTPFTNVTKVGNQEGINGQDMQNAYICVELRKIFYENFSFHIGDYEERS
jgi:hypothetical protein